MNVYADKNPDRMVEAEGRTLLFFSGTSYLGLASNKHYAEKVKEGIDRYGTNFPVSRSSNIRLSIYDAFEQYMSRMFLAEDCLCLSSGFLAGRLLVDYFQEKGVAFYAPDLHPTLWGNFPVKDDKPFEEWVEEVLHLIHTTEEAHYVIFTNSLSNLKAIVYPFEWLKRIHPEKNVTVIIDDSHGIGVTGSSHKGVLERLPLLESQQLEIVVVDSIGKALGVPGGIILGASDSINAFKKSPFYTGSSPIAPAYLHAFMETEADRLQAMNRLSYNIRFFKEHVPPGITPLDYDYPVFLLKDENVAAYCLENGILLSSFPYPNPDDSDLTRIVLNAWHTEDDLLYLTETLRSYYKQKKKDYLGYLDR